MFQVGLSDYRSIIWIPARYCAESRIHVLNSINCLLITQSLQLGLAQCHY